MVEKAPLIGKTGEEEALIPTYTHEPPTYVCDDCGARGSDRSSFNPEDLDLWVHEGDSCPVVDALMAMHRQGYPLDDVIKPGFWPF